MEKHQKKHHRGRRENKKKIGIFPTIIMLVAIGIFVFSGYQLYKIYAEYRVGEKEYEGIQKIVIQQEGTEDKEEVSNFVVDFETLKSMNPHTVAWIRFIEPSQINYPIVKGLDNSKYLNTTFEGKRNASGAIFMDVENSEDFSDKNTFIYGHNMKNGSMFAGLRKYKNADFCAANPYFYIYTPDGKESTYQIFAVSIVSDVSGNYRKIYADDADFLEYIKFVQDGSLYPVQVEIGEGPQVVSLSTCTNVRQDERLLVQGIKIKEKPVEAITEE